MNSFFDFRNQEKLWKRPPDIKHETWELFKNTMQDAEKLLDIEYPIQVDIELNSGCNMRCPFCIHGYGKLIKNNEMPKEQYTDIIDQAVALGAKSLKLNGINEPLLRKDLEQCIAYAKSRGIINIYFVTNGSGLNKKRRTDLIHAGVTKIFISIDAITAETYGKQRLNANHFEEVVRNTQLLIEERNALGLEFPLVRVSFLKNKINQHEAQDFEKYWINKVDLLTFQTMNDVPDITTNLALNHDAEFIGCDFPFKQLVISAGGDIFPCCKFHGRKMKIGNIKNMTLKEAWQSDTMKSLRKIHSEGQWQTNQHCSQCINSEQNSTD